MRKSIQHTIKGGMLGLLVLAAIPALASCGEAKVDPYDLDFTVDTKGANIEFWTGFGSDIQEVVQPIIDKFTEQTGINVELQTKGGYDALYKAINLSASHGTYPHVALAYPDHVAAYVQQDTVVRLDYYLENGCSDGFSLNDFYSDYMTENQTIEYDENGKGYTLGLPFNKSTEVMVYNKTFFDWASSQEGYTDIKVPSTWDEVRSVGTKIKNLVTPLFGKIIGTDGNTYTSTIGMPAGVSVLFDYRNVTSDNFVPISYDSEANFFITLCRQWGGEYTTYDREANKGYIAFDSQAVKTGLQEIKDLYTDGLLAIPSTFGGTTKYGSDYFKNFQSVMNIGSSAGVKNCCPSGDAFKVGVTAIPYKSADHKYVISQGTNVVLLDRGSKVERVAAWKLMKFLSKEMNGYFAANTSYFPSGPYSAASSDYQKKIADTDPAAEREEPISTADEVWYYTTAVNNDIYTKASESWTKFVDPAFIGSSTIRTDLATVMSRLMAADMTPESLIAALKSELGDYVK